MESNCSRCGVLAPLCPANISRRTGERLYRSWCLKCEKARKDAWRADNKDRHNAKGRAWATENPERRAEVSRRHRDKTPPEKLVEYRRRWREANPLRARAQVNSRRRALRQAQPKCLTDWDKFLISEIYHLAQLRGHTVDHIVPIQHKLVCGLHAPWNLQVIPAHENSRKSNSLRV